MRGLDADNQPGYRRAISAVGCAAMSDRSCSNFPPRMPWPTMFRKARTRVVERSMMRCLKSSKLRQPELPASTTVVTPERGATGPGNAVIAGVRVFLARSRVHVRVNVDDARRDEQPSRVNRLRRIRGIDLRRDRAQSSRPKSRRLEWRQRYCADRSHARPAATGRTSAPPLPGQRTSKRRAGRRKTKSEKRREISVKVILQAHIRFAFRLPFSFLVFRLRFSFLLPPLPVHERRGIPPCRVRPTSRHRALAGKRER